MNPKKEKKTNKGGDQKGGKKKTIHKSTTQKDQTKQKNDNININNYNSYIHYQHTNTSIQNNIHASKVHCGSAVRFGQALPGFFSTAHHLCALLMQLAC